MANLGNLYFDILLQDKTDKQLKEIRSKVIAGLKKELPALDIKIDRSKLAADVRKALSGEKFTIDVRTSDGKALGSLTAGQLRAQRAAAIQAESEAKVALANARAKAAADRASASLQRLAAAHAGAAGRRSAMPPRWGGRHRRRKGLWASWEASATSWRSWGRFTSSRTWRGA